VLGDSLEKMKELPNSCVDLVVTSPPYEKAKFYGNKVNVFHPDHYVDWFLPYFHEIFRILKPSGSFILNINDFCINKVRHPYIYHLVSRSQLETRMKLYDRYYWNKENALPSGNDKRFNSSTEYIFHFCKDPKKIKFRMDNVRIPYAASTMETADRKGGTITYRGATKQNADGVITKREIVSRKLNPKGKIPSNVFVFPKPMGEKHPAPYHVELPAFFIKALTDENDLVIDPFFGSGTTGLAAMRLNRNWIGFEINPTYIEMAKEKLGIIESDFFD
jgi:DNA modification methylase